MADTLEVKRKVYCARHGHSNVETMCFGYHYCGRCGDQVGDSLGGCYQNENACVVGHNCPICKDNARKLTSRDKQLLPDDAAAYVKELLV